MQNMYHKGMMRLKNLKKFFAEILGWIIGIIGIISTIVCAIATGDSDFIIIYVVVVALESILTVIAIWHIRIKHDYEAKVQQLADLAADKEKQIADIVALKDAQKSELEDKYGKALATIISTMKNASKLNNDLCNRIPEINAKSYSLLEALQKSGISDQALMQEEIAKSYKDFANALFDLFKRYSSNLLSYTVTMVEAYLRGNDCALPVSATIKLFDKPLMSKDDRGAITVYTAFRDKRTYEETDREIGQEPYTIEGNIDFGCCLVKDHFIINNAKKDSGSYINEHVDFDKYYNCAVVVPIRIKQANSTYKFLGFLCCDCLNQDESITEIFGKEVAQILFALAQIYGTFLETLDSNWLDRTNEMNGLPASILALIFGQTYTGKRK